MLEQKGFVATDEDIEKVTKSILTSSGEAENGKITYLKSVVATVQAELGAKPRLRTGARVKLDTAGIVEQLKAADVVNERFYVIVTKVASESVPVGTKDRGIVINRRTNFARTALYAVKQFIRAGNDITTQAAASVSKSSLSVSHRARPINGKLLRRRAEQQRKILIGTLGALASSDKALAIEEMQFALGALTAKLMKLGVTATRDADLALSENRPLRVGRTFFMAAVRQNGGARSSKSLQ